MKAINDAHELEYGEKPEAVAKAPGRFHLIGEHSWFFKDKTMFVGDFIFEGNIGRCDLEGGDYNLMRQSIEKIKKYPDDTIIYSGHGEFTNLGHEKDKNYYFNI